MRSLKQCLERNQNHHPALKQEAPLIACCLLVAPSSSPVISSMQTRTKSAVVPDFLAEPSPLWTLLLMVHESGLPVKLRYPVSFPSHQQRQVIWGESSLLKRIHTVDAVFIQGLSTGYFCLLEANGEGFTMQCVNMLMHYRCELGFLIILSIYHLPLVLLLPPPHVFISRII